MSAGSAPENPSTRPPGSAECIGADRAAVIVAAPGPVVVAGCCSLALVLLTSGRLDVG